MVRTEKEGTLLLLQVSGVRVRIALAFRAVGKHKKNVSG